MSTSCSIVFQGVGKTDFEVACQRLSTARSVSSTDGSRYVSYPRREHPMLESVIGCISARIEEKAYSTQGVLPLSCSSAFQSIRRLGSRIRRTRGPPSHRSSEKPWSLLSPLTAMRETYI